MLFKVVFFKLLILYFIMKQIRFQHTNRLLISTIRNRNASLVGYEKASLPGDIISENIMLTLNAKGKTITNNVKF